MSVVLSETVFMAVGLRHLHAAIPHPVVYIAAPKENQAGFQLRFRGMKAMSLPLVYSVLCSFRVDSSCKPLIFCGCAWLVANSAKIYQGSGRRQICFV
jgi:hypothetical protein